MQTVVEAQSKKLMYMHWPTYQIRKKGRDFRKKKLCIAVYSSRTKSLVCDYYAIYVVVPQ